MKEWLDVPQLAEQTNLPDSTVRRYLVKFKQFFSYKGGKRSRRYESSAIRVLLRIKALYAEGFETAEVTKTLLNEFPVVTDGEQSESQLESAGLPALATAEDIAELKEALAKHNELNRLLLQNQHEQNELIKKLMQDNEDQKHFNESLLQAIIQKNDTPIKALPDPEQSEINQKLLQELGELKQHVLESLPEKKDEKSEEKKEEAAEPPEEKKPGLFKRLFG